MVINTGCNAATTALNLVLQVKRRLAASPTDAQLAAIADLLGQLNTGTLNR